MRITKAQAKERGQKAFKEGKPRMSNPFNFCAQQPLYLAWDKGWCGEWIKAGGELPVPLI
jgi:hypothetical protein